jgi:hypothetical protein
VTHVVERGFPERILLMFVFKRDGISDMLKEVRIGYGQPDFPSVLFQIIAEGIGNGKNGLFPGRFVGPFGGRSVIKLHLCKIMILPLSSSTNQSLAGGYCGQAGGDAGNSAFGFFGRWILEFFYRAAINDLSHLRFGSVFRIIGSGLLRLLDKKNRS